jgi:hypothetical protein
LPFSMDVLFNSMRNPHGYQMCTEKRSLRLRALD